MTGYEKLDKINRFKVVYFRNYCGGFVWQTPSVIDTD